MIFYSDDILGKDKPIDYFIPYPVFKNYSFCYVFQAPLNLADHRFVRGWSFQEGVHTYFRRIILYWENSNEEGNIHFHNERELLAYPPGEWEYVTSVPADCEDYYVTVVPTLSDSTRTEGMYYSVFFVRARSTIPGVYLDSAPGSGYSVDNLTPAAPQGLNIVNPSVLDWDDNEENDLAGYIVRKKQAAIQSRGTGRVEMGGPSVRESIFTD